MPVVGLESDAANLSVVKFYLMEQPFAASSPQQIQPAVLAPAETTCRPSGGDGDIPDSQVPEMTSSSA